MRGDDPHLVERLARLAAFHDLPAPVVAEMTVMASELQHRPVGEVHAELTARVEEIRRRDRGQPVRATLRLVPGTER